jgi:hypothetical protein
LKLSDPGELHAQLALGGLEFSHQSLENILRNSSSSPAARTPGTLRTSLSTLPPLSIYAIALLFGVAVLRPDNAPGEQLIRRRGRMHMAGASSDRATHGCGVVDLGRAARRHRTDARSVDAAVNRLLPRKPEPA